MDDPNVHVTCTGCHGNFEMVASNYERAIEADEELLCPSCMAQYEDAIDNRARPCFEYYKHGDCVIDKLNKIGMEGWELVAVSEGVAYFKREVFK